MVLEVLTALGYKADRLLCCLQIHPEDGRSMVLKIIDIYLREYSDFFTIF